MFESLNPDACLDERDGSLDDDWVRAAEALQSAWERHPDVNRGTPALDVVREVAFKRTFGASGGNHDLAATVSDDFGLICQQALLGVDLPFVTALQRAYEAHQIPH